MGPDLNMTSLDSTLQQDPLDNMAADFSQRWRVVTSTKTKLHRSLTLHSAQALTSLTFALAVGVNGIGNFNKENLCVLRSHSHEILYGEHASCNWPISGASFSILLAVLLALWDFRLLKLAPHQTQSSQTSQREKRIVFVKTIACAIMGIIMLSSAISVMHSTSQTCKYLYSKNREYSKCDNAFATTYGKSLAGLNFGLVVGYVAAGVWLVSAFIEGQAYRRKETL
ncbi:hypothetical protein DFJ77DRAFT_223646 [Powellomyces hirtus]|nr:hypothetical protein DFJ77DRAFT_223646 [Powellomyces hirtus]